MSKDDFEKFLADTASEKEMDEAGIDWDEQRNEWIELLEALYSTCEGYLEEYIADGRVTTSRGTKRIFEEAIGQYDAPTLEIRLAGRRAVFDPLGTVLIGTKGRANLNGAAASARFILTDKDSKGPKIQITIKVRGAPEPPEPPKRPAPVWTWKIITNSPREPSVELTEDIFLETLMEVVGA